MTSGLIVGIEIGPVFTIFFLEISHLNKSFLALKMSQHDQKSHEHN